MKKSLLEVAREIANDLYDVGAIDLATMREFDILLVRPRLLPLRR